MWLIKIFSSWRWNSYKHVCIRLATVTNSESFHKRFHRNSSHMPSCFHCRHHDNWLIFGLFSLHCFIIRSSSPWGFWLTNWSLGSGHVEESWLYLDTFTEYYYHGVVLLQAEVLPLCCWVCPVPAGGALAALSLQGVFPECRLEGSFRWPDQHCLNKLKIIGLLRHL